MIYEDITYNMYSLFSVIAGYIVCDNVSCCKRHNYEKIPTIN